MTVQGGQKTVRPKNAASLLLIDWQKNKPNVLMGRRHANHIFMPDYYVFPGGRVDRNDYLALPHGQMHEADKKRLTMEFSGKNACKKACAIALAAIRETYEETSLIIGVKSGDISYRKQPDTWHQFYHSGAEPNLSPLRYFARAITPPGYIRRFDTRFFMVSKQEVINPDAISPSSELDDLQWVNLSSPPNLKIHGTTEMIMKIASAQLLQQQSLQVTRPIHFFYARYGKHHHEMIAI